MTKPYQFDEFFASGLEESISPFLTPRSRKWGKNLSLKSASSAALLLALSFAFSFLNPSASHLLLACVYFLVGTPALIAAFDDLLQFEVNIDVLMTLAAFVALLLDSGLEGALLLVLFEISHGMEEAVSKKTKSALHNLNNIAPKFAYVVKEDRTLYEKSVREIERGTLLLVKQGEIVPLDGKVVEGISSLNLVHLTGETIPIPVAAGDSVPAGGRNLESALLIEVLRTNPDSTLNRIIQLIATASEAKPRVQKWLDRFGKRYATTIILLTLLFSLTLPLFLSVSYLGPEGSIYRALAFLIAASPCALIIATPTAYLSSLSACAKRGILLKGGITLDALSRCTKVAFDKTGTLTTGELDCLGVEEFDKTTLSPTLALSIAYSLERHVVHPIAKSICRKAEESRAPLVEISAFQSIPGFGLKGKYGDLPVAIGLPEHIASQFPQERRASLLAWASRHEENGHVLAILAVGQEAFLFRFTDQLRRQTSELVTLLKKQNLEPIMLTGDHQINALRIAKALQIEHVFANLRPEDKLAKIEELARNTSLAMVGDGINDAPALARATVGISMGRIGSATAIDASDVVLLNDDLHLLPWLFAKSRQTLTILKQNLTLALSVILFATTPALLGLVPLWAAVLLHEGGTVLVGLNSLRLIRD